jgi:hypothetical protein
MDGLISIGAHGFHLLVDFTTAGSLTSYYDNPVAISFSPWKSEKKLYT